MFKVMSNPTAFSPMGRLSAHTRKKKKVNNKNTRTINKDSIVVLVSLLLTFNIFHTVF